MNFLVDHNLSPHIARALNAVTNPYYDDEVIALADKYPKDISDEGWIKALSQEGRWCFLTGDKRLSRSSVEKTALRKAGLTGFILSPSLRKKRVIEQTARLLLQWPLISKQARIVSGGALFEIPAKGTTLRNVPF